VQFDATYHDESHGYQPGSVIKLWTVKNEKFFNIIHLHVNDQSENVPVDVKYLDKFDYDMREINFGKDFSGQALQYMFLVYDMSVREVLYNGGEKIEKVPFEEIVVKKDAFYKVVKNNYFGKLKRVPNCLISYPSKDFVEAISEGKVFEHKKINGCLSRYFELLSGFVEFEVHSTDNLISLCDSDKLQFVESCICHMEIADEDTI